MTRIPASERRTALIEAALRVVSRNGITQATTRAIVAEADMSLASFHYAFDSRDELIDELITTVVAREQQAVIPDLVAGQSLRELLESGLLGYFEHLKADPEHEQAMLELTQYALRSPERHPLALAQYARYAELAERSLELGGRARRGRVEAGRSPRWPACSWPSPTDSPSPGSSIATTPPPGRSRMRPPTPSREWPTPDDEPRPRPARVGATRERPTGRRARRAGRAGSRPDGSARSRPCGSASGWPSSRPCSSCCPRRSTRELHPENWVDSVVAFGMISGIAAIATVIAYPLTGALSDRTASRFGRRRPWIVIGALVFALSLVVLGLQTEIWAIGAAWVAASIGFCIMTAALTATISDQVPVNQRGFVSGWMSAPQAVGTILGLLLVTELVTDQALGYALLAVLARRARDPVPHAGTTSRSPPRSELA